MTENLKEQIKRIERIEDFRRLANGFNNPSGKPEPGDEDYKVPFEDAAKASYERWVSEEDQRQEELDELSRIFGIDTEKPRIMRPPSLGERTKSLIFPVVFGGVVGFAIGRTLMFLFG